MMNDNDSEVVAIDIALLSEDARAAADLAIMADMSLLASKAIAYFVWGYVTIALYTYALGRVAPLLPIDTTIVILVSSFGIVFFGTVYGVAAEYKGRRFGW